MTDWDGKLAGATIRIAGLLHLSAHMAKLHESAMRKSPRFEGNPGSFCSVSGGRSASPRDQRTYRRILYIAFLGWPAARRYVG